MEYKIFGARNASIRLIFISKQNIRDCIKIREKNKKLFEVLDPYDDVMVKPLLKKQKKCKLKIIFVETVYQIIPYALIDPNFNPILDNFPHNLNSISRSPSESSSDFQFKTKNKKSSLLIYSRTCDLSSFTII